LNVYAAQAYTGAHSRRHPKALGLLQHV
jgi:hypothetical protein